MKKAMFPCLDCTLRRMGSSIPGGSMCLLVFASTSNPGSGSSLAVYKNTGSLRVDYSKTFFTEHLAQEWVSTMIHGFFIKIF
uniref:Uncharacterized protein n=1 Tax=Anguilla anguilla TaxID=7936 RepID=A0A0E9XZ81_ANGAN